VNAPGIRCFANAKTKSGEKNKNSAGEVEHFL
jgi:hypothetical protein